MAAKQPKSTPPHVSLRSLRKATGLTLEQVAEAVADVLTPQGGERVSVSRGTISAIETGTRGVSREMLAALEIAYGLDAGDIVTDYQPRSSRVHRSEVEG